MQRAAAALQEALERQRAALAGLERLLSPGEAALAAGGGGDCAGLGEAMLRPRLEAVRLMAERAGEALDAVEHLVTSGLCAYCFPEEADAPFRLTAEDGPAARRLAALAVQLELAQEDLRRSDAQVSALDAGRACTPAYLSGLLAGAAVGESEEAKLDDENAEAVSYGVEAVGRLRRWPLDRRRLNAGFARGTLEHLDEDFLEVAECLLAFLVGPPSRLAHQVQVLALALDRKYHWSSNHAAAHLFWRLPEEANQRGDQLATLRIPASAKTPTPQRGGVEDPGAAFGLVVLLSRRMEERTVEELVERLEGPRALFLEDACGDALGALGGPAAHCRRPALATRIQELTAGQGARRPRVAWRRRAATRSAAHSAWDLAASYWGAACTVWLADLRPARTGAASLAEAVAAVPGARLRLVHRPEELLGLAVPMAGEDGAGAAGVGSEAGTRAAAGPHRAWAPDTPLATRLAEYLELHRRGLEALAGGGAGPPVLVYSCQPSAQCGDHGDRLNGIATAFLLAVLTRRVFLLDSEKPLPLQTFLAPRLIDWRVRGGVLATAGLRHHSYHDRWRQFEADIGALKAYDDPVLVLSMNHRMIRALFEAPELREEAAALGLPEHSPPFLIAEVFDVLFAPAPPLRRGAARLRSAAGGLEDGQFIALHLHTGDLPEHRRTSELASFLACARYAEAELGLPSETPWLLATDSSEVATAAADTKEARAGKLQVPGATDRVHVDRSVTGDSSDLGDAIESAAAGLALFLLLGRAAAAVLSEDAYGEAAAEVGRVQHAYFAPGGACVRMELSSS